MTAAGPRLAAGVAASPARPARPPRCSASRGGVGPVRPPDPHRRDRAAGVRGARRGDAARSWRRTSTASTRGSPTADAARACASSGSSREPWPDVDAARRVPRPAPAVRQPRRPALDAARAATCSATTRAACRTRSRPPAAATPGRSAATRTASRDAADRRRPAPDHRAPGVYQQVRLACEDPRLLRRGRLRLPGRARRAALRARRRGRVGDHERMADYQDVLDGGSDVVERIPRRSRCAAPTGRVEVVDPVAVFEEGLRCAPLRAGRSRLRGAAAAAAGAHRRRRRPGARPLGRAGQQRRHRRPARHGALPARRAGCRCATARRLDRLAGRRPPRGDRPPTGQWSPPTSGAVPRATAVGAVVRAALPAAPAARAARGPHRPDAARTSGRSTTTRCLLPGRAAAPRWCRGRSTTGTA